MLQKITLNSDCTEWNMDLKEKHWISAKWLALKPVSDNVVLADHFRPKPQMVSFFFIIIIEQQSSKLSALWRHTNSHFHYSSHVRKVICDRFSHVSAGLRCALRPPTLVIFVGKQQLEVKTAQRWGHVTLSLIARDIPRSGGGGFCLDFCFAVFFRVVINV